MKKISVILIILYTVSINRYLVKNLAEVLPIFVIVSLHKVMYWISVNKKKMLSIEKWWLIRKIFKTTRVWLFLCRETLLSFESVRLCDRALSAWFSYSCNENLCNVGGGGGRSIVLSVIMV